MLSGLEAQQSRCLKTCFESIFGAPRAAQEWPRVVQERPRGLLERFWGHLAAFWSHLGIENVCFSSRFPILFENPYFGLNIASEGILGPKKRQLGASKVVKSAPRAAK